MANRYDTIRDGILTLLEGHRVEVETRELNWLSITVYVNGGNLNATWQQEESCRSAFQSKPEKFPYGK